ncbi:hypothetical protein OS493_039043 [Desmophyllum pertusum]|uniref:Uncharacterized protein n=1 Tax=Desmophyllum pertusum TaxID=174260 RepID=A0A9X0CDT1_9CNID|nr:hypothetical protein OS493_039043 [Desmophyllum pertusum]
MSSRPVSENVFIGPFNKLQYIRDDLVRSVCYGVGGFLKKPGHKQCLCKKGSKKPSEDAQLFAAYNYPNAVNQYGAGGLPCCPANTFCADKPPCPPNVLSDLPSAPLDAGLSFNMAPGGVQVPTAPSQPAAVLSVPIQDQTETPTQPQIPLHAEHPEKDKVKLELQPNRDQVYHLKGMNFKSLGCWKDTWDRAIPLMEKKHAMLFEPDYKKRTNALMKCAEAALDNKFIIFSLQNGGQCFSGKDADQTFMKYGVTDSCKADGEGGPWGNEVYQFSKGNMTLAKNNQAEGGISKESIAQANPTPTTIQPTTPTAPPTLQPTSSPAENKVEVNKSQSANPWAKLPKEQSIDKSRKPDLKSYKDEVEQDAVVAENEADKQALLTEVPGAKANKTDIDIDEESDDAISEDISSQTQALNVRPPRPRLLSSHHLSQSPLVCQPTQLSRSVCGNQPIQQSENISGGQLFQQCGNSTDRQQPTHINTNTSVECPNNDPPHQVFPEFPPLPVKCSDENVDPNLFSTAPTIFNKIQVSLQSAQELHAKTIGQANNNLWYKERKYRITASTFGKIMKRKSPPTPAFVRAICNPRDISNLPFVKYGRENEGRVADLYVKKMHEEGNTGLRIAEVGLCVNPALPHLGASLDRAVFDPLSNDKFGGSEIKTCPKAGSLGLSVADTVGHPSFAANHFWF